MKITKKQLDLLILDELYNVLSEGPSYDATPGGQSLPADIEIGRGTGGDHGHGGMSRVPPSLKRQFAMLDQQVNAYTGENISEAVFYAVADMAMVPYKCRKNPHDKICAMKIMQLTEKAMRDGFASPGMRKYKPLFEKALSPKQFNFLERRTGISKTPSNTSARGGLFEGDVSREKRMRDMEQGMPRATPAPDPTQAANPAQLLDQAKSLIRKLTQSTQASTQGRNMNYSPSRATKQALEELDTLLGELSEYIGGSGEAKGDDWFDDEHETMADRKFADRPQDEEDTFSADKESFIARESKLRR